MLNQSGSKVFRGNLLVIPIGDSILYVEPIFIEASSGTTYPELKKIIVANDQKVVWANTLGDALSLLTGASVTTAPSAQPSATTPPATATLQQLVSRIDALYADAEAKRKSGDVIGYLQDIQQLGDLINQLKQLSGSGAAPRPSPSPSRSP